MAEELGDTATFSGLDVTDEESWTRLVESTETRFGPASVLVNNAAIIPFAHLADMDAAGFDRCLAVNVRGTFLGMRALAGSMTRAGAGRSSTSPRSRAWWDWKEPWRTRPASSPSAA